MAVDPARQFIEDVEAKLTELRGGNAIAFKVGSLKRNEQDRPPQVKWSFGDIDHSEPELRDQVYIEEQELEIQIWGIGPNIDESEANTRSLKNQVLLAARIVGETLIKPIEPGTFSWADEAHAKHGRKLEGSIVIHLPVPARLFDTVVIEQAQFDAHAQLFDEENEETVFESPSFPPPDP